VLDAEIDAVVARFSTCAQDNSLELIDVGGAVGWISVHAGRPFLCRQRAIHARKSIQLRHRHERTAGGVADIVR
jgi:hypothetical protein